MSMKSLGSLTVDLVANDSQWTAGMTRAERSTKRFEEQTKRQNKELERVVAKIDPVVGKLKELDRQQDVLNKARERGTIDQKQFDDLNKKLEAQRRGVKGLGNDFDKTGNQANSLSSSLKSIRSVALIASAAIAAAAGGMVAFTDRAAQNARELRNQAQVAKSTVEEFQQIAYASRDVGIEQDKLSDILKDVNDRIGDFAATGGGPMADFFENIAPKVGITADAFKNLSGPESLQLYYDSLEKANLSQEDMTFYLEAMASDTTALIPLLQNGGARLSEMADEADRMGIVLSSLEVAQLSKVAIEIDKSRALIGGVGNALAVELAPFVLAIAENFGEAVEGVGDMKVAIQSMVDTGVIYLGTFLDAVWEIDRDIQIAGVSTREFALTIARSMQSATIAVIEGPVNAINFLIEKMNAVPGIDIDFADQPDFAYVMRDQLEVLEGALQSARGELDELASAAAPSEKLNEFISKAREAAAAITVDTPPAPSSGGRGPSKQEQEAAEKAATAAEKAADAINKQVIALQQQAATLGETDEATKLYQLTQQGATVTQIAAAKAALDTIAAYESSEEAAKDYEKLLSDLRTTEEQLTASTLDRLAVLDAANVASNDYVETVKKIADAAFIDAPEFGGLDASVGGPFGELNKIDDAQNKLQEWYDNQLTMLNEFRTSRAELSEQWDEQERTLNQEHQNELIRIEQARQQAQLAGAESIFSELSSITKQFAGEQSGIFKAMFAIEKAFAIASSIISIQQGIASAASLPFPANLPAMASVAASTAGIVSTIQSTGISGMAHDGIDSVPREGTWLLDKGERVTTANTSKKLDKTLDNIQNNNTSNASIVFSPTINVGAGSSVTHAELQAVMKNEHARFKSMLIQEKLSGGILSH